MEIEKIKEFFAEFRKIPNKKKSECIKLLIGITMLCDDSELVHDLIYSDKDFDGLYTRLVESLQKDDGLFVKEALVKKLDEYKEILRDVHLFFVYKTEAAEILQPFDMFSNVSSGAGSGNPMLFLTMLSLFNSTPFGGTEKDAIASQQPIE